jgi:hypothetical protein
MMERPISNFEARIDGRMTIISTCDHTIAKTNDLNECV